MLIIRHHRHPAVPERALLSRPAFPFTARRLASTTASQSSSSRRLPVDVYDTGNAYVVTTNVPGVDPKDVEVTVEGDRLSIKATLPDREGRYLLRERRVGEFSRTLTFETPVQPDTVQATFANGVIELVVPKAPEAQPKKIKVAAA